jgi:HAD superfamily hydrolase (TIGR01450 family)
VTALDPAAGSRVRADASGTPALAAGCPQPLCTAHDVLLVDLDGVVYVGAEAVPGAPDALDRARATGSRVLFVTNNAARPPGDVAAHLSRIGVRAGPADVVTSAQAAAGMLADRLPDGAAVLVVGGEGLERALAERGLRPVRAAEDDPVAVAQGFSPGLAWPELAEAAYALGRGLEWVATNRDRTLPTPRGLAPGNGSFVALLETATGRSPRVAGKPERPLFDEAVTRSGGTRPLMVGDRLDTDVGGANGAGLPALLVLTGVSGPAELLQAAAGQRPAYLAGDLGRGLADPHPPVRPSDAGWACGGWLAQVRDGRLLLDGDGQRDDALRALCLAAWTHADEVGASGSEALTGLDLALGRAGW